MTTSSQNNNNVQFRYFRVLDKVTHRDVYTPVEKNCEHTITLATKVVNDQVFVGYSLNRVPRSANYLDNRVVDQFNSSLGRKIAENRLNSHKVIVLKIDSTKSILQNIIDGLLALPTTSEYCFDQSVPSALKAVLRKNVREFQNSKEV
jgi:hypothetical protein